MKKPNVFAGSEIDRAAHRRRDEDWLRSRRTDSSSRVLPMWRSRGLVLESGAPRAVWVSAASLTSPPEPTSRWREEHWIFLGELQGRAHFALDLSHLEEPRCHDALREGDFRGLRHAGSLLPGEDAALLAYAEGVLGWHRRHRFCGACGARTRSAEGGHVRICESSGCGRTHFPRTDPAVIMLVERGELCLLGRQREWEPRVYSTLAGFVEPGESLEEAVAREVLEETDVVVDSVAYHSSQPWPFPGSLMLGFQARALTEKIRLCDAELEDARWFSRQDIPRLVENGELRLPRQLSIARRLIEDWLASG